MIDISAALPTFVITLREGVEAALVVGIVMAYLQKANQSRLNSWVYGGIGIGVAGSVLVGVLLTSVLSWLTQSDQDYAAIAKPALEGGFEIGAIALLSWMLIWMTQQAKSMKSEVEGAISSAVAGTAAGWSVLTLIAIAVLREGFETVLFIAAKFQQGWIPVAGAIAGLVGAVIIGVLLFRLGVKINLRRFFQVMGVLLLLIVAGLVVSALRHIDGTLQLLAVTNPAIANLCSNGSSCLLGPQVWDLSSVLPDRQFPGILLKAFFGYTQYLYLAQAIAYVGFLATVGVTYLQGAIGWNFRQKPAPES
jgi:high-affinity iron transporter